MDSHMNSPEPQLNRRDVLATALAAATALHSVPTSTFAAEGKTVTKGRIKQSIVFWCFNVSEEKWTIEKTCEAAKVESERAAAAAEKELAAAKADAEKRRADYDAAKAGIAKL